MTERWFRRREVWWPTWRAVAIFCLLVSAAGVWFVASVHDWLSVRAPLEEARYAIVEGWAPDPVPWAAKQWADTHDTTSIYVTGVPIDKGMMESGTLSFADITASTLQRMGVSASKIKTARATNVNVERTRAMARALKASLDAAAIPEGERRINLFTNGTHARRSWMHFKNELGPTWQVGVISVPSAGYPANRWWRYSEGVKSVIEELIGLAVQTLGGN